MRYTLLPLAASSLLLSACALNPPQLGGSFAQLDTTLASTGQFTGSNVRWGGIVAGARSVDGGTCLEIGWYPLDRITWQPLGLASNGSRSTVGEPLNDKSPHTVFYSGDNRIHATPRFLACGEAAYDSERYFTGSVITVSGAIEPPKIYAVDHSQCAREEQPWKADYSGTVHADYDELCVVSLPALKIKSIVAWKKPPSSPFPYQAWGW
ncbi:MAG: Slp family lipoprotein [Rudaea sp.]